MLGKKSRLGQFLVYLVVTIALVLVITPFAWMVLGERLGWVEWLAMACVIVASVGAIRTARRRSGQEAIRHARAEGA